MISHWRLNHLVTFYRQDAVAYSVHSKWAESQLKSLAIKPGTLALFDCILWFDLRRDSSSKKVHMISHWCLNHGIIFYRQNAYAHFVHSKWAERHLKSLTIKRGTFSFIWLLRFDMRSGILYDIAFTINEKHFIILMPSPPTSPHTHRDANATLPRVALNPTHHLHHHCEIMSMILKVLSNS